MNRNSLLIAAVFAAAMALNIDAQAQKKGDLQENPAAPASVRVDGNLSEWDPGRFTAHEDTRISYLVSNDDRNLYLAVRSADRDKISKMVTRGITLTVNTDGKKKAGPSVTFPAGRVPGAAAGKPADPGQALRSRLSTAREIRITGMKSIRDGGISTENEYGILAAGDLDSAMTFACELAVPLDQLGLSPASDSPVAIGIRINGIVPPRIQAGPRSPYESMRRGGYGRAAAFPEGLQPEEFWIRRTLTTQTQ